MIKSDGQRQLYAIGGKNYSSVELRSIERYDLDRDTWICIKTILNQKGMFTTAITFENRYVYVMDT
jgi:Kelch motif